MKGATIKPQADVPSIPSKYTRVLVESDKTKHRFSKRHDLKMRFNTEPGPGTYNHKIRKPKKRKLKHDPPGFISGDQRFREEHKNDEVQQVLPGPGTYEGEKLKLMRIRLN